jgi:hypothetical protein
VYLLVRVPRARIAHVPQAGRENGAHRLDVSTSSSTQGPLVSYKLTVGQTLTTYAFPTITTSPVATSGNLLKFGVPQTPTNFRG